MNHQEWIGAIDQGTTSSRFIVFDKDHKQISKAQVSIKLHSPHPGWTQQNPAEIIDSVKSCIAAVEEDLRKRFGVGSLKDCIKGVGLTNQRETTIAWDCENGDPIAPAIVWNDTRTKELLANIRYKDEHYKFTGLPLSTYFSSGKIRWLFENYQTSVSTCFGTVDSWLCNRLLQGNPHITDCTNASRSQLYNLSSRSWDDTLRDLFSIPKDCLPIICDDQRIIGTFSDESRLEGIPLIAILGDQHAALYGHGCSTFRDTKITYGTGCFLMQYTEQQLAFVPKLLSTLAYSADSFAIEAPISMAGVGLTWLTSSLGMLPEGPKSIDQMDLLKLASISQVFFLPALNGLLAPYWSPEATASFHGLTLESDRRHMILALLESIAFSCRQAVELLPEKPTSLIVDGGLTGCKTLMQIQAALLPSTSINISDCAEATALGAARKAAHKLGLWKDEPKNHPQLVHVDPHLIPLYEGRYRQWLKLMAKEFPK